VRDGKVAPLRDRSWTPFGEGLTLEKCSAAARVRILSRFPVQKRMSERIEGSRYTKDYHLVKGYSTEIKAVIGT